MLAPAAAWCLRDAPGERERSERGAQPDLRESEQAEPASSVVCAACRSFVTWLRERIERDGTHTHTFLNPEGMVFRIRCFGSAPGALPVGERSDYWSWFPGFHWQACVCRACFEHLGWRYDCAGAHFHGLIAERVLEVEERTPRG
jgi:hypothetical protein